MQAYLLHALGSSLVDVSHQDARVEAPRADTRRVDHHLRQHKVVRSGVRVEDLQQHARNFDRVELHRQLMLPRASQLIRCRVHLLFEL